MAVTQAALGFAAGTKLFRDTANGATAEAVKSSSGTIYGIQLDNSANSTQDVFLKLFHTNAAVTVGTTVPEDIIHGLAGSKRMYLVTDGKVFASGLQAATLTGKGATSTAAPASAVDIQVIYT